MQPSNRLSIVHRVFDYTVEVQKEIGKYENIMLQDLNVSDYLKDVRKAFESGLKELELNLNSQLGLGSATTEATAAPAKAMQEIETTSGLLNKAFKAKGKK